MYTPVLHDVVFFGVDYFLRLHIPEAVQTDSSVSVVRPQFFRAWTKDQKVVWKKYPCTVFVVLLVQSGFYVVWHVVQLT